MSIWPKRLLEMLEKNPETEDFVLSYPFEKDKKFDIDISPDINGCRPPLFMQWDKRWGYRRYSGEPAAFSGCGPVCLSMAACFIKRDKSLHPGYMIDFAAENGFSTDGSGSLHSLIDKGGEILGLKVETAQTEDDSLPLALENGDMAICLMGPGDFTAKGHFVLLCPSQRDNIKVNDPNSLANSRKSWRWRDLQAQIRKAWIIKK